MNNLRVVISYLILAIPAVYGTAFSLDEENAVEMANNAVVTGGEGRYLIENFYPQLLGGKKIRFKRPVDIANGADGNLYVLFSDKIFKVSQEIIKKKITLDPPDCKKIKKIAADSQGNIFAIKDNNLLLKISQGKTAACSVLGKNQGQFSDIAIDRKDSIYLSDMAKGCIYKIAPDLRKFVFLSGKDYGFRAPKSITLDGDGGVYVLDVGQKKIYELIYENKKSRIYADVSCVKEPCMIRSGRGGTFIYLIGKDNTLYLVSKFGAVKKIAYFSKWHTPSGGISLDKDDSIYLTTGGKGSRIIRMLIPTPPVYGKTPEGMFFNNDYGLPCSDYFMAYKKEFYPPDSIIFDAEGNLYVIDEGGRRVVKIGRDKHVEVLIDRHDGLTSPEDIAFDKNGNIYISDHHGASQVFRIDRDNKSISVYAGRDSGLESPSGIVFDKNGDLFVTDEKKSAIIKIRPDKKSEIFADSSSGLSCPENIAIDRRGFLYVTDSGNGKIFRFNPKDKSCIVFSEDLIGPEPLVFDKKGNLYVGDEETSQIYEFKATGEKCVYAKLGTGTLRFLAGLAFSNSGELYVSSAEYGMSRIARIVRSKQYIEKSGVRKGQYRILALVGKNEGLFAPSSLAYNKNGKLFICDVGLGIVFLYQENKLTPYAYSMRPKGLAIDKGGDLFMADEYSASIYFIDPSKRIRMIASRADGLYNPEAVTIDDDGGIYIADEKANKIFEMKNGRVSVFMDKKNGINNPEGVLYDNGLLYIANAGSDELLVIDKKRVVISRFHISGVEGIAIDSKGNIYVSSDTESRIYMLNKKGEKAVIADFYDGIMHPEYILIDGEDNLLIADKVAGCVFKLIPKKNE